MKICFAIYDMGGGHRSTANALKAVIEQRNLPWQIEIVEVFKDVFKTNLPQYLYNNWVLKKKWARAINDPFSVPLFKLQIRLRDRGWRNNLQQYWREQQPDLVVSLMPLINRVLCKSLRLELPGTPFVTAITDFADCPPHFWIEPQEQFLICPSERAVKQAQAFGYRDQRIFQTSGVVIHPRFNEPIAGERLERQSLGLKPDLPTGLVIFGAQGSEKMLEIADRLERSSLDLQLIFICGRNEKLATELRNRPSRYPKYVEGFTKQIPHYMHLSDFFISKPGSVGISEAIALNLPAITECNNTMTLFQERATAQWLARNGFGMVVDNFRDIDQAVAKLIEPKTLSRYRANVEAYHNRAGFEVVEILERILEHSEVKKLGQSQPSSDSSPTLINRG